MKKTFLTFVSVFATYEVLFFLSLLDYFFLDIIDYDKTSYVADAFFAFTLSLLFFIGILLGWIMLLKANEKFSYLKPVKIITSLFYIVSPLGVLSLAIFYEKLFFFSPFVIPGLVLFFLAVACPYFFNYSQSKGKKIAYAVFNFTVGSIATALVCFISTWLMYDGSVS